MYFARDRGSRMGREVRASLIGTARSRGAIRVLLPTAVVFSLAPSLGGCGGAGRSGQPVAETEAPPQDFYAVRIDRTADASAAADSTDAPRTPPPREFLSQLAGVGRAPADNRGPDGRAAAREAAIIEAFFKALIETRRSSTESTAGFVVDLSDRLQAARGIEQGVEVLELRLLSRGAETVFQVRGGVLQHPAHDFELICQVFAETQGRYSLISAERLDSPRNYVARVACYEPAGSIEALADAAHEP